MSCKCDICKKPYNVDLLVPDEIWEKIKPENKQPGAGLICPTCIIKRFYSVEQLEPSAWFLSKGNKIQPASRPEILPSKTSVLKTGFGHLYVTISYLNGNPFEVFCTIGKSGRELTALTESIGRLISIWLRSGGSIKEVINQLKGIGGESPIPNPNKDELILSVPDGIGKILEEQIK